MLAERGWRVRDGLEVSRGIDRYRDYIGASRGEFTVAKDQNVRLRTGWFSDRSATYLASGRPVVTQDTGFGSVLPTGEGLFAFDSLDAAAEAVDGDRRRLLRATRRAARELAREHFSHETVLGALLERARRRAAARRSRRRAGDRCSRPRWSSSRSRAGRPRCRRATVEAAQRQPISRARGRRRRMGPESASIVVVTHDGLAFTRLCLETRPRQHRRARLRADRRRQRLRATGPAPTCASSPSATPGCASSSTARNMGFAPACNQGLGLARGEHLVLLNNDTMVPPGWLAGLLPPPAQPGRRPGRPGHQPDRQRGRGGDRLPHLGRVPRVRPAPRRASMPASGWR